MHTHTRHSYNGFICGKAWGGFTGSLPVDVDLKAIQHRFVNGDGSYREILESLLMERGGDFINPLFPADAVVTVTYRKGSASKYCVRVKELRIADIAPDLVSDIEECELYDELA